MKQYVITEKTSTDCILIITLPNYKRYSDKCLTNLINHINDIIIDNYIPNIDFYASTENGDINLLYKKVDNSEYEVEIIGSNIFDAVFAIKIYKINKDINDFNIKEIEL